MTADVLPPEIARLAAYPPDAKLGPATWLMYADGTAAPWPPGLKTQPEHPAVDVWDNRALKCRCRCHGDTPARGHGYQPPALPEHRGPETWVPVVDLVPREPQPVDAGEQLTILRVLVHA